MVLLILKTLKWFLLFVFVISLVLLSDKNCAFVKKALEGCNHSKGGSNKRSRQLISLFLFLLLCPFLYIKTQEIYVSKAAHVNNVDLGLKYSNRYRGSRLLYVLKRCNSVCFVGNSITEGSANGFHGWYEPLKELLPHTQFLNVSKGGKTTKYFVSIRDSIANVSADCFVLSIGCNDIRYRHPDTCSMDSSEYITSLKKIVSEIRSRNINAKFVFIAPWICTHWNDPLCNENLNVEDKLYEEFSNSLQNYCKLNDFLYINPNPYIRDMAFKNGWNYYIQDHIHPNNTEGIKLYAEACVISSIE